MEDILATAHSSPWTSVWSGGGIEGENAVRVCEEKAHENHLMDTITFSEACWDVGHAKTRR